MENGYGMGVGGLVVGLGRVITISVRSCIGGGPSGLGFSFSSASCIKGGALVFLWFCSHRGFTPNRSHSVEPNALAGMQPAAA